MGSHGRDDGHAFFLRPAEPELDLQRRVAAQSGEQLHDVLGRVGQGGQRASLDLDEPDPGEPLAGGVRVGDEAVAVHRDDGAGTALEDRVPLRLGDPLGRQPCDHEVEGRLPRGCRHGKDARLQGNRPPLPIRDLDRRAEQEAALAQLGEHEDPLLRPEEPRDRLAQVGPGAVGLFAAESHPGCARPQNARVLVADRHIAIDALELLDQRLDGRLVFQRAAGVRLGAHSLQCFLEGISDGSLGLDFCLKTHQHQWQ
jgi:hypothetical protein